MVTKWGHYITSLLLTAFFLLSAMSCSDRSGHIRSALAAADSLMMTQPQAALDTLMSIDSSDAGKLSRADKAFYTLLRTEAEYKCFLPVAGNTAISEAADYYRRKGPEDRLARALVMQGAVFSERSDLERAMLAYKEAEPLLEHSGDPEQLGLLHTQIGVLYQQSFINDSAAIARDRKALACFEKAELPIRIMYAHVSLARMLMVDSVEKALPHLEKALSMAEQYRDRLCVLSASDLLCHIYQDRNNVTGIISTARNVLSEYGSVPQSPVEDQIYKSMLFKVARGYVSIGDADSARYICDLIPVTERVDSMMMLSIYADIAELEGDMETFWKNRALTNETALDILKDKYSTQLLETDLKADNFRLESELNKRERDILLLVLLIVLGTATAVTVFLIIRKALKFQRTETAVQKALVENLNRQLSELTRQTESEISSLRREKQQEETARKDLEQKLAEYRPSDPALMNFFSLTYRAMREIICVYDIHQSNPRQLLSKSVKTARKFITDTNSYANTEIILASVYPDFLNVLFSEFPDLHEEERHLIMLTCLGYPNGAVCAILDISETNLSTRRTRLAHKMGIDKSLAKYLYGRLNAYLEERNRRS